MSEPIPRSEIRAKWFIRIEGWQKSGLSQAEYCRRHDLKLSNFYNWSLKYRQQQSDSNLPRDRNAFKPDFIPVALQSASSEMTLSYGDISLHFPMSPSPESLVPWIKALRAGAC